MISGLFVRRPRDGDRSRLAELYRDAFAARTVRPGGPMFRGTIASGPHADTLVAEIDGAVVGFSSVLPASGDVSVLLGSLEPATRAILAPLGRERVPGEPMPVRILAPAGVAPTVKPGDLVVYAITVDPAWRRRGVARALLRGTITLHPGAQLFAHCIAGTGSRELFEGLGFTPLVELGRYYTDGTGMTFVWRAAR